MEFTQVKSRKRKRSGTQHNLPYAVQHNIENLFEKKFVYSKNSNAEISPLSVIAGEDANSLCENWLIAEYKEMKDELNALKNNLNDKDMLSWHEHTRKVNLAGQISTEIRNHFRPELCTQAWCKFYEIASTFLDVSSNDDVFSVHLCEAPGAFITSLNQYLFTNDYKGQWDWLATTLNPYYEGNSINQMIDDDRFIRCTRDRWYFGEDGTGDLMSKENLEGLMKRLQGIHVDLVTADGSIDCQFDPAEQEAVVSRLHHCEVFTALLILAPGGTFVVKMFTLFEGKSIGLVYLLNCVFEQVTVFKPCTSKGGNSEVYVVCQDYKGRQSCEQILSETKPIYFGAVTPDGCLFSRSNLPEDFMDQHTQCVQLFKDLQMSAIQRNLDLYDERSKSGSESNVENFDFDLGLKGYSEMGHSRIEKNSQFSGKGDANFDKSKGQGQVFFPGGSDKTPKTSSDLETNMEVKGQTESSRPDKDHREGDFGMLSLEQEKEYCMECFFNKYTVRPLSGLNRIMRFPKGSKKNRRRKKGEFADCVKLEGKFTGSFQERQMLATSPWQQRLVTMEVDDSLADGQESSLWIQNGRQGLWDDDVNMFEASCGLPVDTIRSSRFCPGFYIFQTQHIVDNVMWLSEPCEISATLMDTVAESIRDVLAETLDYYNGDQCYSVYQPSLTVPSSSEQNCTTEQCFNSNSDKPQRSCDDDNHGKSEKRGYPTSELENSSCESNFLTNTTCPNALMMQNHSSENKVMTMPDHAEKKDNSKKDNKTNFGCKLNHDVEKICGETAESDMIVDQGQSSSNEGQGHSRSDVKVKYRCTNKRLLSGMEESQVLAQLETKSYVPQSELKDVQEVLLYPACSQCVSRKFELVDQPLLYDAVMDILQHCTVGQSVVIEMGPCLTRLTAGLVYCLYWCFAEIGFIHHHDLLMRRHLVCVGFRNCPIRLQHFLQETRPLIQTDQSETLLEIIPVLQLQEDADFTEFLQISNTSLLQSFITSVVKQERQFLLEQTTE